MNFNGNFNSHSDDSWIDVHNPNMDVDCDDPPTNCPGIALEKYTAAGVSKAKKQSYFSKKNYKSLLCFCAFADRPRVRVGQDQGEDERREELLQVQGRRRGETGIWHFILLKDRIV